MIYLFPYKFISLLNNHITTFLSSDMINIFFNVYIILKQQLP